MAILSTTAVGKNSIDLQNNVNTILAGLTTSSLRVINVFPSTATRRTVDFQATIVYETGGPTLAQPYQVQVFGGGSIAIAQAVAQAFITANPTYWFGPIQPFFIGDSERYVNDFNVSIMYNTDYTSGVIGYLGLVGQGNDPEWISFTIPYTSVQTAALTNAITLYTLPAKGVVHAVKQKHSTAFTGGAIATCTSQIGITGTPAKYAAAFNIFQAPADTAAAKQITGTIGIESDVTTTPIILTATSTVANLSALTQGSLTVSLLVSIAP
jgi:hypothetical protein